MKKIFLFFAILMAISSHPLLAQDVNMNKYITLTVQSGQPIGLNFQATKANTPVRIVSGSKTENITVGTDWYVEDEWENDIYTVTSDGNTMTIYGDIVVLNCGYNQAKLTAINLSNNTELKVLNCYNNQLTSLDVSKNTQLKELKCYNNQLTSINIGNNKQLELLNCYNNQLTSLDVRKNIELEELYCNNNQLTSLDVSNNTELIMLHCYNNQFSTEAINKLYCSLPDRTGKEIGNCHPLNSNEDSNYSTIIAATAQNARDKNWNIQYRQSGKDIPSNGNYDCNSGADETMPSGISVFPNPATNKVQVQLDENVNETLILVDITGRAVLLADVVSGKANIDVSNLSAGTYLIKVGNRVEKLTVE